MQRKVLLCIVALAILSGIIAIAEASESCELTTNYPTGPVPLGNNAVVTATTSNPQVNYIDFTWVSPNGNHFDSYCWTTSGTPFESTQTLNMLGTWRVYVNFVDNDYGTGTYQSLETQCTSFEVRHTTINAVPEVPLGTIGIALAMVLGFTAFIIKKKTANPKRSP